MSTTYDGNDANYPASLTIPSDGDAKPVASVNAALEGLADRTAVQANGYRLFTVHTLTDAAFAASTSSTSYAGIAASALLCAAQTDDLFVVHVVTQARLPIASNSGGSLRIVMRDNYPSGSDTPIDGTEFTLGKTEPLGSEQDYKTYVATFSWDVGADGNTRIVLQGKVTSGSDTIDFGPSLSIVVQHYRRGDTP
jgi:hypothetical protein